jgi:hypothetical protein
MTQDAYTEAATLQSQISAQQLLLTRHLAAVQQHMAELTADEQASINTILHSIHDPQIAALQTQFTNLSSDYKKS